MNPERKNIEFYVYHLVHPGASGFTFPVDSRARFAIASSCQRDRSAQQRRQVVQPHPRTTSQRLPVRTAQQTSTPMDLAAQHPH